jgi:hypothetical protein
LVGVVTFVVILRQLVVTTLATAAVAAAPDRNLIVSFVFSFLILAIGIFFVLFYKPWAYLWAYIGLAMRYTVNVSAASRIDADPSVAKPRFQPSGTSARQPGPRRRNSQL